MPFELKQLIFLIFLYLLLQFLSGGIFLSPCGLSGIIQTRGQKDSLCFQLGSLCPLPRGDDRDLLPASAAGAVFDGAGGRGAHL